MFYTKRMKDGDIYHGHDRSDHAPGEAWIPLWQRRAIKRAYEAGEMTTRAIAYHFGCHERTVARIAREYGLPPKKPVESQKYIPVSDENFEKARALWATNAESSAIAALLGVKAPSHWRNSRLQEKMKVEFRRRGIPYDLPRKPRSDAGKTRRNF